LLWSGDASRRGKRIAPEAAMPGGHALAQGRRLEGYTALRTHPDREKS
jgi:hypothetical protein